MNAQETPIKDQETPLSEEHPMHGETQEGVPHQSNAVLPREQYARPGTPPTYFPPVQPSPGSRYSPWTGPAWAGQPRPYYQPRRSSWPWVVLTCFLLFLLLISGAVLLFGVIGYHLAGSTQSVTETRSFTVSSSPMLVLTNDTGSVHVHAASSSTLATIQVTKRSGPWGNLNNITVSYVQDKEANTITVTVTRLNGSNSFNAESADFDITVPSAATLQLKTNTGSIDVSDVSGQLVITSNTGSLTVHHATVSGNSELITNTGSVTFDGAIASSGSYQFETNTGSVNVTLPADSVFHVNASTDTGSINTNFPGVNVQHRQMVGADASGDVGSSPQATVILRTNTGSVNLYQR